MPRFIPERLKEIMVIRGRKLDELAKEIGVTKQAISKYTNGKSLPSPDVFKKLMSELSVPPAFFSNEKFTPSGFTSPLFFRATSSTTKTAREYAHIISEWGYEIANAIGITAPVAENFIPHIPSQLNIFEKSLYLRDFWGLGAGPIENLIALLESHGFYVFTTASLGKDTDAYSREINGLPIIIVNESKGSAVRQRFSIAHELGHLILHKHISKTEFELKNKIYEAEASTFAGEFLLPSSNYGKSFNFQKIEEFLKFKQEFKISLAAMVYNCKLTGLIDDLQAKRLQMQISKKWGRMAEPFDDELEKEKPFYIASRIMETVNSQESFERFMNILCLPANDVAAISSLPVGYFDNFSLPDSVPSRQVNIIEQLSLFD